MLTSKNEVLKMVESGRPVPEIAESLGIGNNLIYYWVKRAKKGIAAQKARPETGLRRGKAGPSETREGTRNGAGNFKKSLGHFQSSNVTEVYRFIQLNEDNFPCQMRCQVLDVSRSGYYAWKTGKSHQPEGKIKLMEQKIIHSFRENKRRYGSRRIVKELHSIGDRISRYKAGKVLRNNGLKAIQPRSFVPKTLQDSRHAYVA